MPRMGICGRFGKRLTAPLQTQAPFSTHKQFCVYTNAKVF
jgi:hypothetical protein